MYLLGYHGNNLYPKSLRLFSDKAMLMGYLAQEWRKTMKRFEDEGQLDAYARRFETFDGYIKMITWRLYELDIDSDLEPRNIRSTTLQKWAREFSG